MPKALQAAIWFTCAINILTGVILFWAWLNINVAQPTPFTPEERTALVEAYPSGHLIGPGTFQVCVNGVFQYLYSNGKVGGSHEACWR